MSKEKIKPLQGLTDKEEDELMDASVKGHYEDLAEYALDHDDYDGAIKALEELKRIKENKKSN